MGCRYGIKLQKAVNTYDVQGRPQGWRLQITVPEWFTDDTDNYPDLDHLFVYMTAGIDPITGDSQAIFQSIASPSDFQEYPAQEPTQQDIDNATAPLFFRTNSLDIVFRSRESLEDTWNLIVVDRDELIRTLERMCIVSEVDISSFGRFADDDPSPALIPEIADNLVVTGTTNTDISLEWQDRSDNEDGFKIERSPDAGVSWFEIAQVGQDVTTYTDSTGIAGITYTYRVRSFNDAGNAPYSNLVIAELLP